MAEIKTYSANNARVYIGSSTNMDQIASGSVNLIITSPPYWTLKDYDVEGQIGTGSNSYDYYISKYISKILLKKSGMPKSSCLFFII